LTAAGPAHNRGGGNDHGCCLFWACQRCSYSAAGPGFAQLVLSRIVVDAAEGFMEVAGQGPAAVTAWPPAWFPMVGSGQRADEFSD
jgi:hypothetical protein